MRPVVLKGEKVSLAIFLKEDLSKSWEWYNDRSTIRNFFNSAYFTPPEEEEEFYGELKKNKERAPVFAVIRNDGTSVGVAGFNWINWIARWGEVFYYIAPDERGKGYGTETVELLCQYAFTHLNLRKVWAKVHEDNLPSIRVLEKNGFSLSGRFREHVWSDGRYLDELIYEKFRRDEND